MIVYRYAQYFTLSLMFLPLLSVCMEQKQPQKSRLKLDKRGHVSLGTKEMCEVFKIDDDDDLCIRSLNILSPSRTIASSQVAISFAPKKTNSKGLCESKQKNKIKIGNALKNDNSLNTFASITNPATTLIRTGNKIDIVTDYYSFRRFKMTGEEIPAEEVKGALSISYNAKEKKCVRVWSGRCYFLDENNKETIETIPDYPCTAVEYSPDNNYLAIITIQRTEKQTQTCIYVKDLATNKNELISTDKDLIGKYSHWSMSNLLGVYYQSELTMDTIDDEKTFNSAHHIIKIFDIKSKQLIHIFDNINHDNVAQDVKFKFAPHNVDIIALLTTFNQKEKLLTVQLTEKNDTIKVKIEPTLEEKQTVNFHDARNGQLLAEQPFFTKHRDYLQAILWKEEGETITYCTEQPLILVTKVPDAVKKLAEKIDPNCKLKCLS